MIMDIFVRKVKRNACIKYGMNIHNGWCMLTQLDKELRLPKNEIMNAFATFEIKSITEHVVCEQYGIRYIRCFTTIQLERGIWNVLLKQTLDITEELVSLRTRSYSRYLPAMFAKHDETIGQSPTMCELIEKVLYAYICNKAGGCCKIQKDQ